MSAISSHLLAGAKIMTVSASDPDVTTNSSPGFAIFIWKPLSYYTNYFLFFSVFKI